MSDADIQSMLEHANKSGKPGSGVSVDDFYRLMQKKVRLARVKPSLRSCRGARLAG